MKIGEETRVEWYVLEDGSVVSFHTGFKEKDFQEPFMIYADRETWPSIVADRLGLSYVFMRNSTTEEVEEYLADADLKVKEKVYV